MLNSTPTHVNYMYVHALIYLLDSDLAVAESSDVYILYMYIVHVYKGMSLLIELKMFHYSQLELLQ